MASAKPAETALEEVTNEVVDSAQDFIAGEISQDDFTNDVGVYGLMSTLRPLSLITTGDGEVSRVVALETARSSGLCATARRCLLATPRPSSRIAGR